MCNKPWWLSKLNWFKLMKSLKCLWCLICFPTCLSRDIILIYLGLIEWFVSKGPNETKLYKLKMFNTRRPTIVHFQVHFREWKYLSICLYFSWMSFLMAQLIERQHHFRGSRDVPLLHPMMIRLHNAIWHHSVSTSSPFLQIQCEWSIRVSVVSFLWGRLTIAFVIVITQHAVTKSIVFKVYEYIILFPYSTSQYFTIF